MAKFTLILEQSSDGSWAAYKTAPSIVGGLGATKEAAIENRKEAISHLPAYMKEDGEPVEIAHTELIQVEVAA